MKAVFLAAVALCPLLPAPAVADEAPSPPPRFDWSGLYFGINGGGAAGDTTIGTSGSGNVLLNGLQFQYGSTGSVVGATAGYNIQFDRLLIGIEADGGWANIAGANPPFAVGGEPTIISTELEWLATLRARAGFVLDRFLIFGTAGLAAGGLSGVVTNFPHDFMTTSVAGTQYGFVVGAGAEIAVTRNFSAKVEYLHVDLGTKDYFLASGDPNGLNAAFHPKADLIRFGVNYRFP